MCKNHNYCHSKILEEFNNTLKCNQKSGQKSMKIPFITYSDTKSLLEEIKMCESNPEKLLITNTNKHTAQVYSKFT